jgi:hypothetical protein
METKGVNEKEGGVSVMVRFPFFLSNGHYIKRCSLPFHSVIDVTS